MLSRCREGRSGRLDGCRDRRRSPGPGRDQGPDPARARSRAAPGGWRGGGERPASRQVHGRRHPEPGRHRADRRSERHRADRFEWSLPHHGGSPAGLAVGRARVSRREPPRSFAVCDHDRSVAGDHRADDGRRRSARRREHHRPRDRRRPADTPRHRPPGRPARRRQPAAPARTRAERDRVHAQAERRRWSRAKARARDVSRR